MNRTCRIVKICLIIGILFVGNSVFITDMLTSADSTKHYIFPNLNFDQYVMIDYDSSLLNQTIDVVQSLNVPLTITYWTSIPKNFLKKIWWQWRNKFLYGYNFPRNMIMFVNVTNKPDWADVWIAQPVISLDIPKFNTSRSMDISSPSSDSITRVTASLIVSPYEEAPAQAHTINLEITLIQMQRLQKVTFNEQIAFTPTFAPKIQITTDPVKMVCPHDAVNFKIHVKNAANKKARIIPQLTSMDSKWNPTINPPFFDISSKGEGDFVFSVVAPYEFGWHDNVKSFQINFTTVAFPLNEGNILGGPYNITLTVNNHGFSTPGFEILIMMVAIVLINLWKKIGKIEVK